MPLTGISSTALGSFGQPSTSGSTTPRLPQGIGVSGPLIQGIMDEDDEGENELLPGMADEDYSAQQTYQTESKDNLKSVHPSSHIQARSKPYLQSPHGQPLRRAIRTF
jgi:hypothetical protein